MEMPLLEKLIARVAPFDCMVCEKEGSLLCNFCAQDAFPTIPSRCYRCKRLTSDFQVCSACRKRTSLKHVWVVTEYAGVAEQLVKKYKFERTQSAAGIMMNALDEHLPFLTEDTIVIPVPTATHRIRERGYDHAYLIGRGIAKKRNFYLLRGVARLSQARQVGSSRKERYEQLKGVFLVPKIELIRGNDVLIVDDVTTTGATLEVMAQALKKAGAKQIDALVFAQKQ